MKKILFLLLDIDFSLFSKLLALKLKPNASSPFITIIFVINLPCNFLVKIIFLTPVVVEKKSD